MPHSAPALALRKNPRFPFHLRAGSSPSFSPWSMGDEVLRGSCACRTHTCQGFHYALAKWYTLGGSTLSGEETEV